MTEVVIGVLLGFVLQQISYRLGYRRGRYDAVRDLAPRKTSRQKQVDALAKFGENE